MSALFAVVASAPGFADCSAATATVTLPAVTTTLSSAVTTTVTLPAVTTALNSLVTTTITSPVTVSGSCSAVAPITIQQTITATATSTCPAAIPTNPRVSCNIFLQNRPYVFFYSGSGVSPRNRNAYNSVRSFRADLGPCSALQGCAAVMEYTSYNSFYLVYRPSLGGSYECLGTASAQNDPGLFSVSDTAAGAVYAYAIRERP
ncbi:hypothetical protein CGLO_00428 [Colletotrichum gloeosporioides Cg-14]|uniref:Uncharacterized protein n=1 Tax=Colletotrichum gloeosporioides (strain Cg-14) TaxID=1237896 RepID=T0M6V2_COLGC|nr:hypothetical protein CGLO_00428 [Colletotrichum gloeosporioides Cg-14]